MAEATLVLSQVLVCGTTAALLAAVIIAAVRRPGGRVWIPTVAAGLLLAGTALGTLGIAQLWGAAVWFIAFPLLMASYPDGRLVPQWAVLPVSLWLGLGIAYVATGSDIAESSWWLPVVLLTQPPLLAFQVYRYRRRMSTVEREQVRWAILGVIVELAGFAVLQATTGGIGEDGALSIALANLVSWPIPAALAIGLVRPRVVRIDPLLHTVVIMVASAALLASCFGGVGWLARTLGAGADAAAWWAAVALAAAVAPVVTATRRLADWTVYGGRSSPQAAGRALARRLDALSPAGDITGAVVDEVMAAVRSPAVELIGAKDAVRTGPRATSVPEGGEFPVSFLGEQLATLHVAPRPAESTLTRRDQEVIAVLAAHAAPALHGARALGELAEARSSILLAREEERKRLRRDLHDDLAPTLAGLGLGASAITELADETQTELRDVAADLQQGIREAIAQTRHLAHGLRPAILDDHGLVEAVRARARVLGNAGIEVTVSGHVASLPAAVEIAALLIVQEALTNVLNHSSATHCDIAIESGADGLDLRIEDNGVGLGPLESSGIGLTSMHERAAELGGRTTISSRPGGGTRVRARLGTP